MIVCVNCGREIESDSNQVCDSCQNQGQIASTTETTTSKVDLNDVLVVFKNLIINPEEEIKKALNYSNIFISSIIVILTALIISLTISILLMDFYFFFSSSFMKTLSNTFFIILLQWAAFSLIVFSLAKLTKNPIKVVQSFNIVGISQIYVLAMSLVMLIFSFVSIYLALASLSIGLLMSYLVINSGFKNLLKENPLNIYLLPGSVIGLLIIDWILLSLSSSL